ncbi:MAG: type II secretion system F family protein [Candidatus Bathyarchaeia archaeon]
MPKKLCRSFSEKNHKRVENELGVKDICYAYFNPVGKFLFKVCRGIDIDMEAANMKIHPEVYLSIIGLLTLISTIIPLTFLVIIPQILLGGRVLINPILYIVFTLPPILILMLGIMFPKIIASNRISGLKTEIPYASMYISVMARGGLSPYNSLLRLRNMELLPKLRDEIERIQRIVLSTGMDPISAMEKAAKVINLKDYKDLLLGYASTLRTGGDVLHYLYSQTEVMFRKMAARVKAMGESMGSLLEAYIIVGILGALGLYLMFVISFSLPQAGGRLSAESFFMFAFIILPIVSLVFMYMGDTLQINYPVSTWKSYMVLLGSIPIGLFLVTQMVVPFLYPDTPLPRIPAFTDFVANVSYQLNFAEGSEPAWGLALALIAVAVPVVIVDQHYSKEEGGILQGITSFFRDLVENRKTGLSPEKCIQILSNRDYGRFSKYLKRISSEIGWGLPLRQVFDDFKKRVRNWLALVNIYLLIDTIAVGGGTEESLETLAEFSESTKLIEQERKGLLAPLILVPYIGVFLLTSTTTMFLTFFRDMSSLAGTSVPFVSLSRTLLTPLIFHSFMFGLVTGKLVTGRVSSGFKNAIFLTIAALVGIWITTHFTFFKIGG